MKIFGYALIILTFCVEAQAQLPKVLQDDVVESYNWIVGVAKSKTCNTNMPITESDIEETPINKCEFIDAFEMKPNPANSTVFVTFKGKEAPTQIVISGLDGRAYFKEDHDAFGGFYNNDIDINTIPPGIYLLSIIQEKEAFIKKLIIQ